MYSGSAVVLPGEIRLFYTGNVKEPGEYDYILSGRQANVITVTTADGSAMSEKQVLLRNSDYPADCSCHVRDPKIWREEGIWKMVLGARTRRDRGCVLVYHSQICFTGPLRPAAPNRTSGICGNALTFSGWGDKDTSASPLRG